MKKKLLVFVVICLCFLLIYKADASKLQDQISAGLIRTNTLNNISRLPKGAADNPQKITSMFLRDMGYPENIIQVQYFNSSNLQNFSGDTTAASFNFITGELSLNSAYKNAPPGVLASFIRHELDHFQKGAQLCKSMGINNFARLFGGEKLNVAFWQKVMPYTKVPGNFDQKKYISGVVKYTFTSDFTSPYWTYSAKTDGRRNAFEITAYNLSDAIMEYYHIPNPSTTLNKVAVVFNNIDWKIYNLSTSTPALKNERVAIFDYYYAKTLILTDAQMAEILKNGITTNSINNFWRSEKTKRNFLYNGSNITQAQANTIINILNAMNATIPKTLTIKDTKNIFEFKYMTLLGALKQPEYQQARGNILVSLNQITNDYLQYMNTYSTSDSRTKLGLLITKLQLSQTSIKMPNGQIKNFGQFGDNLKFYGEILKNAHFKKVCAKQNANACLDKLVEQNKL